MQLPYSFGALGCVWRFPRILDSVIYGNLSDTLEKNTQLDTSSQASSDGAKIR